MQNKATTLSLVLTLLAVLGLASCETTGGAKGKGKEADMLTGLVLGPEGEAIPFAKVSILPQAPDESLGSKAPDPLPEGSRGLAVTTEGGRWVVDHVSDEAGTDLGLPGGYYYEVTIYKPGYHIWRDAVLYDRGTLQVDTTLYPDTIDVEDVGNLVDTSLGETNTGTGVLRQGE